MVHSEFLALIAESPTVCLSLTSLLETWRIPDRETGRSKGLVDLAPSEPQLQCTVSGRGFA